LDAENACVEGPKTRYSANVRALLRRNLGYFLAATLIGLVLRALFVWKLPAITSDSLVYGDIAKNWLQHAIYGLSERTAIAPTYIRLPGYPAFLTLIFAIFGIEHYRAALVVQMLVDIGTCLIIADIGRRLLGERAAKVAFLLAVLCPFLANYAAAALTETWEIFFTALAFDLALRGLSSSRSRTWVGCGLAVGGAILLRPDGALLLIAIELYLATLVVRRVCAVGVPSGSSSARDYVHAGLLVAISALLPLVPWTLRNLRTFHEFQPLAPRYANDENAFVPLGFERWMRTWIADYASTEEVYWSVPGSTIDSENLPSRAFDSQEQRSETEQVLSDYNQALHITPELDSRFAALAAERIHHAPFRYYVWLPALRIADMWARPRTEILPCNTRWWEFDEEPQWLVLMIVIGIVNLVYLVMAGFGLFRAWTSRYVGLLLTFVILRSAFLGTLENPESRYTLECYPVVILLAAAIFRSELQPRPN
jgi:4-amino-4-deoxy-L-arabinose transferase-like glycosyltransferase